MYVLIAGAGKVGWNLARELIAKGHEVTLVEHDRRRYLIVEQELEHAVQYGDATELWILERAGIQRADMVIAVTGDDEDNMLICQVAKEKYLVDRIIARVNNPRNLQHFKLLDILPAVSATDLILRLIEHEVPKYGLVHLLDLEEEQLEIIEMEVTDDAPAAGRKVIDIDLPEGSLIISVLREGGGHRAQGRHRHRGRRRGPAGARPRASRPTSPPSSPPTDRCNSHARHRRPAHRRRPGRGQLRALAARGGLRRQRWPCAAASSTRPTTGPRARRATCRARSRARRSSSAPTSGGRSRTSTCAREQA